MVELMVPSNPYVQRLEFEDWENGKEVEWIDRLFGLLDQMPDDYLEYKVQLEPVTKGPWSIERHDISKRDWGRLYYVLNGPQCDLNRDCGYGDTTVLKKDGETWMSDTRAEIYEHFPLINKLWWSASMEPSILINGLGLGLAVRAAQKHNASRIDVVELDEHVIEMVAPNFEDDPRVTIHHANAFDITWPKGHEGWTFAWHDIWPTIAVSNISEMDRLRDKYRKRVQWQASWQRKGCLKMRRIEKQLVEALQNQDWKRVKELDPSF